MKQIDDFVDERNKSWCVHCGSWINTVKANRDHVPSKSLLINPLPENLPTVKVCSKCNAGFSLDEEYFAAFLSTVLAGSTNPDDQLLPSAKKILSRNSKLRSKIDRAKVENAAKFEEAKTVWSPESERINRVILKNARGHAYFEFGEPMLAEPRHIWTAPLSLLSTSERTEFEDANWGPLWPEVGSRMLTRTITGADMDQGWVIVQGGVYRYAVGQVGVMIVRSVLFEYLATEVYWEA